MAVARRVADPPRDGDGGGQGRDLWFIEPMPKGLIDSPLDFIFAEHHRQREAALMLSMLADGEFDARGVERLIDFLNGDFSLHVGDEELVLFPALKANCQPEDDVERIIERLQGEHREDEASCTEAVLILQRRLSGIEMTFENLRRLRRFSDHIRQHLALENGVLLPIARVRLEKDALNMISHALKERRQNPA